MTWKSEFTKVFLHFVIIENDKCPPWSLQADKMRHDKINKTIYYNNAVIKVFDIPIFYTPKFYLILIPLLIVGQVFYHLHFQTQKI